MKTYNGYILSPNPFSPTLVKIATEGQGGRIPKVLEGSFTSYGVAEQAIDTYLESLEVKRGKTSTKA